MFKVLRNFIIGLLIGAVVFFLALPYIFFHESPTEFYPRYINAELRKTQDTRQLARFFDDRGLHLPILTYRQFAQVDEQGEPVEEGITVEQFEEQMKTLKDIGCTFITPNDLLYAINENKALPSRAVLITFDDCSEEIYTEAFPILKKYEINATVNVIGYYVKHRDNYNFPILSWDELREMTDSGLITLQSETYYTYVQKLNVDGTISHPFIHQRPKESWNAYYQRITKDLLKNNVLLMLKTHQMPIAVAYPYGESNDATKQAMASMNLYMGFESGNNRCLNLVNWVAPYHLPRFEMNQNFKRMQDFVAFINTY